VQGGDAPKGPVRVMLVEDHLPFRRATASLISREPDLKVVAEAGSLGEARRQAASVDFDVAVLNLELPDGNGADLTGALRQASSGAAVMILSNGLDPGNLERAMQAGADEILAKFATPEEIFGAIRRLRRS
jgi:DNA-binding NarL/FixJ family response regulator